MPVLLPVLVLPVLLELVAVLLPEALRLLHGRPVLL